MQTAVFGTGCFWCTEAVYKQLKGVSKVESGYSGGEIKDPSYEEVSTGESGHAESVKIEFDPEIITYKELLNVFWQVHNPTTLNRQGNDVGPQYRSVIFYLDSNQKKIAEESKKDIEDAKLYSDPIVTQITEFKDFYKAEDYHQNYYENNKNQPYCKIIIDPKMEKLKKTFSEKIK